MFRAHFRQHAAVNKQVIQPQFTLLEGEKGWLGSSSLQIWILNLEFAKTTLQQLIVIIDFIVYTAGLDTLCPVLFQLFSMQALKNNLVKLISASLFASPNFSNLGWTSKTSRNILLVNGHWKAPWSEAVKSCRHLRVSLGVFAGKHSVNTHELLKSVAISKQGASNSLLWTARNWGNDACS